VIILQNGRHAMEKNRIVDQEIRPTRRRTWTVRRRT